MTGWSTELERWAVGYADRLRSGSGRDGVAIGGSIARAEQWPHSDLEIAILVDRRDPAITHFNVDSGRGVEIFQLERTQLEGDLARIDAGTLDAVAAWPIQLWRCHITHDPTGLLLRFATEFDRHLFSHQVTELKTRAHRSKVTSLISDTEKRLANGQPRAALATLRNAMNECILLLHWDLGELPRSQNRTASRLLDLTERHGRQDFYQLFRDVYGLDSARHAIGAAWPACKQQVLALTERWEGRASRDFFTVAVDSDFTWGEDDSILCVYRLYVPQLGILDSLDGPAYAAENRSMLEFLGLDETNAGHVGDLLTRLGAAHSQR